MGLSDKLLEASDNGNLNDVKEALKNGADIHAENDDALLLACRGGHLDIVELLLTEHADIHVKDENTLEMAYKQGHLDVVQLLIIHGANLESVKPIEQWFADRGNAFMFECFDGMTPEASQALMEKHGAYVSEQYIVACVEMPDNLRITNYIKNDIEHNNECER